MFLFPVSVENIAIWLFILTCHHAQSSNAAITRTSHMDNNSENSYMASWKHLESRYGHNILIQSQVFKEIM